MIWHKKAQPWTKAETERAELMKERVGCIHCWLNFGYRVNCEDVHHIIRANKRMGHWYTLPLCKPCHVAAHNGTFKHREQIDLWIKLQHALSLCDELPKSKIMPRRAA